jgi:predicted Zn-ribbon and HTH transcriptional regulator
VTKLIKLKPHEERFVIEATWMLLSNAKQKQIHRKALKTAKKKTRVGQWLLIVMCLTLIAFDIDEHIISVFNLNATWKWPINCAIVLPFIVLAFFMDRKESFHIRKELSRKLYHLDIRPMFCLRCDYDLKGSQSDHCPECGAKLASVPAVEDQS